MNNSHLHNGSEFSFGFYLGILAAILLVMLYILAAFMSRLRHKPWPKYRTIFWILGVTCAAAAVTGPLASRAHSIFPIHMLGHLLLGMLAPLFIILAAPMTLTLRTLNVRLARRLSYILKSWPVGFLSHPITASFLNIGGLWLLYTTNLYGAMQQNFLLHTLIHLHVFLAGCVYTAALIYVDPTPHRFSYTLRSIVLILSLSGHGILSRYIYAYPPAGVSKAQAELGGMIMYYGGDVIDIIIIWLLCSQWFKTSNPRKSLSI